MSLSADIDKAWEARKGRAIEVKEWGRTLHVFPLTIGQLQKIQGEEDPFRRAARIIQVRGKNEDGSPQFTEADFEKLVFYGIENYGPVVVGRVAGEIMSDLPAAETAEKNS